MPGFAVFDFKSVNAIAWGKNIKGFIYTLFYPKMG
jgi:hypothetical protein